MIKFLFALFSFLLILPLLLLFLLFLSPGEVDQKEETVLEEERVDIEKETMKEITEENKGYVTFWFDDGLLSTYETAFPVLKEKEWPAVLAVVADYDMARKRLSYDGDFPMEMEKVLELSDQGWEISSHSMSHLWLNSIDDEQILEKEIAGSKKKLESFGLNVPSFTFVYGEQGKSLGQNIVSREYFYWRSSIESINDIPAWRHITSMFVTQETTEDDVAEWIAEAENDGWLVICFHAILEEPRNYWQQTPEQFAMIVEMIENSSLKVVIPEEMFEKFGYAEGHTPKIESVYRPLIAEDEFKESRIKIVIPKIEKELILGLASSSEGKELDFSELEDYPVWVSNKESPFLSPLGGYGAGLIAGHRNTANFRNLDQLKQGDEFSIVSDNLEFIYQVSDIIEIKPEEIWLEMEKIHQKSLDSQESRLVLMTCAPLGANWKRLLIVGKLIS